ncbi:hypothetical protein GCM10027399_21540 [Curvibacter fontanus]
MSVIAAVTSYLSQHIPGATVWLTGAVVKPLIGKKAKALLKKRSERKSYKQSLEKAYTQFASEFPELAASFFDEHFLKVVVADELLCFLTRDRTPNAEKIIHSYAQQFTAEPMVDLHNAVWRFLQIAEQQFKLEESLQPLLDSRQTEEALRILKKINLPTELHPAGRTLASGKIFAHGLNTDELSAVFNMVSRDLLEWPQLIDGEHWIDRPELELIHQKVSSNRNSVSLLLGPPGSGKSALMSRLAKNLRKV